METRTKITLISTLTLGVIGIAAAVYFALAGSAQASSGTYLSNNILYRFADATPIEGTVSTLSRTENGISTTVQTSELEEGHAYTLWWVIFNNPQFCEHGMPGLSKCGEEDVFGEPFGDTPVKVSVQNAGGNIIGGTGRGDFGAYLSEGEIPEGIGRLVFGSGLLDAKKAEVHLVLRDHGPVIPSLEQAQISSFGGACTSETDPTQVGPFGPNQCADVQFAVHLPPQQLQIK
jgi:hypothetical protein